MTMIRRSVVFVLGAAVAIAAGPAMAAKQRVTGEEQLAKLLEGRVAGDPVSCISLSRANDARIIDGTAIVYRAGNVIYVNRPHHADALDDDDIMVTEPHGGQLCRLDTVRLHDRTGMWFSGFVGLDDFVPYRKPAADK